MAQPEAMPAVKPGRTPAREVAATRRPAPRPQSRTLPVRSVSAISSGSRPYLLEINQAVPSREHPFQRHARTLRSSLRLVTGRENKVRHRFKVVHLVGNVEQDVRMVREDQDLHHQNRFQPYRVRQPPLRDRTKSRPLWAASRYIDAEQEGCQGNPARPVVPNLRPASGDGAALQLEVRKAGPNPLNASLDVGLHPNRAEDALDAVADLVDAGDVEAQEDSDHGRCRSDGSTEILEEPFGHGEP